MRTVLLQTARNVGRHTLAATLLGCVLYIGNIATPATQSDDGSSRDCFDSSTGQIYTVPADAKCTGVHPSR